jgi:hypothetical protein
VHAFLSPCPRCSAKGPGERRGDRLPGRPDAVVYDSDKAIHSAVRREWPAVPIHLCGHHLYDNAKEHLREDGQAGWGNTYRTLLAAAGQSPGAGPRSGTRCRPSRRSRATGAWVRHWDEQMSEQTARRASMPPHCSTGALGPAAEREGALPARRLANLLAAQAPRPAARHRLTADQSMR